MDYGMDKNPLWLPMRIHPNSESFVEMWRYTLPNRIIVNDSGAYSFAPSHDKIYGDSYLFVMGVRGLSRSGARGIETAEESGEVQARRLAVVEKIERLWLEASPYLLDGRFMDDVGLEVSAPGVLAKVYRGEGGVAVPVWNTTVAPVTVALQLDLDAIGLSGGGPFGARSLDSGRPLREGTAARNVEITATLPPHDIDVVVLEGVGGPASSN
jgi:hypothetical protein